MSTRRSTFSLRRQRRSYFQTALRQFTANQMSIPARSAKSRRRLGFCHAKVTQQEKRKGAASLQPLVYLARPAGLEPPTPWFVARFWAHQVFEFTLFLRGHVRCKVHDRAQHCITDFG